MEVMENYGEFYTLETQCNVIKERERMTIFRDLFVVQLAKDKGVNRMCGRYLRLKM